MIPKSAKRFSDKIMLKRKLMIPKSGQAAPAADAARRHEKPRPKRFPA